MKSILNFIKESYDNQYEILININSDVLSDWCSETGYDCDDLVNELNNAWRRGNVYVEYGDKHPEAVGYPKYHGNEHYIFKFNDTSDPKILRTIVDLIKFMLDIDGASDRELYKKENRFWDYDDACEDHTYYGDIKKLIRLSK